MTIDFKHIKQAIQACTTSALTTLHSAVNLADVIGLALVSDASAMSLGLAINTRKHLADKSLKYPKDTLYLKWSPQEWAMDSYRPDLYRDLSHALATASTGIREAADFRDYRLYVFECAVQALEGIRDQGLLAAFTNLDVLVFCAIEHDEPIETELDWIERLNPPEKFEEFADWLRSQQED